MVFEEIFQIDEVEENFQIGRYFWNFSNDRELKEILKYVGLEGMFCLVVA